MELHERIRELLVAGESRSAIARRLGVNRGTVSRYAAQVGFPSSPRGPSILDWHVVREFYVEGHSIEECKRQFGFSSSSWDAAVCRGDVVPRKPRKKGRPQGETRSKVAELLGSGLKPAEVASRLGISRPTVSYHARKLGIEPRGNADRRYDWSAIRAAYESGLSVRQCMATFGFSYASWAEAVNRGAVLPRPREIPIDELLVAGRLQTGRSHLKSRLLQAGLKENRCERCKLTRWMGEPLNMELHHINGDGTDNRLSNIKLLCPNCHAQTDNWGGRGLRRRPSMNGTRTG
jgi:DNA-binding CsgD family transcriptional regulator